MSRRDRSRQTGQDAERAGGTLRIRDLGDEVHLEVEQRVQWKVALEILKELKAPSPQQGPTAHPGRARRRASPGATSAPEPKPRRAA